MRKLTNEDLWQLESVIDDGVRYLFIRDGEDTIRHFRMLYPNRAQLRAARLEQHKYKSSLGSQAGLKTRRVLEKENQKELKEIEVDIRTLRKKLEKTQREFTESDLPNIPDAEEDPEGYAERLIETTEGIQDVNEQLTRLLASKAEILSFCIEELAIQHFLERLTQICWERVADSPEGAEPSAEGVEPSVEGEEKVVEGDNWQAVWESWEAFDTDNNQIVQMLVGETQNWVLGGVPFFAQQPSMLAGGIGI